MLFHAFVLDFVLVLLNICYLVVAAWLLFKNAWFWCLFVVSCLLFVCCLLFGFCFVGLLVWFCYGLFAYCCGNVGYLGYGYSVWVI